MIPSAVVYSGALSSQTGPEGAKPLDAFPSGVIQRPPVHLSGITCSSALPTGTGSLGNIPPRMTRGAILQPKTRNTCMIKQETSMQDPGPSHINLSDAEVRMHLSELQRLPYLEYLHYQHTTRETSLPQLSAGHRVATEAQSTQDVKPFFIDTGNSKKASVALEQRTPKSQDRVFLTEIKSRTTSIPSEEHAPETYQSYEDLSEIESNDDVVPSVLDMSLKKVTSTTQSIVKPTHDSLAKTELNQLVTPEMQRVGHHFSQERMLPREREPFLFPGGSHGNNLNFGQESFSKPKSSSGSQNEVPGPPSVSPNLGRMVTINKVALSELLTKNCYEATGSSLNPVSECVPLAVAEVGCSTLKDLDIPTGLMPAIENTKSTPLEMLQSCQSQPCDESTKTMPSSSKANSLQPYHPSLPHSGLATDLFVPHKQVLTKSFEPTESKLTLQNRQSQASEFRTSMGEEVDFREQPPLDNKCPICEDKVSGYHYGLYSCESCKGFFKRTIHSKRHERLGCSFGGGCVVTLRNRKHCAACRFQKCLTLGMKLEAIRQNRQRGGRSLYQGSSEQRRLIKLRDEQQATSSSTPKKCKRTGKQSSILQKVQRDDSTDAKTSGPAISSISSHCTTKPLESRQTVHQPGLRPAGLPQLIQDLVAQEESFSRQSVVAQCCLNTLREEKNILEALCHFVNHQMMPMIRWAKGLPLYSQLMIEDQIRLLHNSILNLLCLNLIFYCLDSAGRLLLPQDKVIDLTSFNVSRFNQLVPKITTIGRQLHAAGLDMPKFVCLKLIFLLNPDTPMIKNNEQVQTCQQTIQDLLFAQITRNQPQNGRVVGDLMLVLAAVERVTQQLGQEVLYDMEVLDHMFRNDVCSDRPWIRIRCHIAP